LSAFCANGIFFLDLAEDVRSLGIQAAFFLGYERDALMQLLFVPVLGRKLLPPPCLPKFVLSSRVNFLLQPAGAVIQGVQGTAVILDIVLIERAVDELGVESFLLQPALRLVRSALVFRCLDGTGSLPVAPMLALRLDFRAPHPRCPQFDESAQIDFPGHDAILFNCSSVFSKDANSLPSCLRKASIASRLSIASSDSASTPRSYSPTRSNSSISSYRASSARM
jgi:hypothetical protein